VIHADGKRESDSTVMLGWMVVLGFVAWIGLAVWFVSCWRF
jgi:hypothetical protein